MWDAGSLKDLTTCAGDDKWQPVSICFLFFPSFSNLLLRLAAFCVPAITMEPPSVLDMHRNLFASEF